MSKHTPGPWKVRMESAGSVGTGKKLVAVAYGDDAECKPDERMAANARLIAAAPELLEALQTIVDCWDRDEPFSIRGNQIGRARSAIRKAAGEAP